MSKKTLMFNMGRPENENVGEAIFTVTGGSTTTSYDGYVNEAAASYRLSDLTSMNFEWTVPDGVYSISAVAIGGGGSGEGSNTANAGSGGGGGGLAYINNYPVTPQQVLKIHVGRKGRTTTDGAAGGQGMPSAIVDNNKVVILAGGGGGGHAQTDVGRGAHGYGTTGAVIFKGGDGGTGGSSTGGDGGNAATYTADGSNGASGNAGGDGGSGTSPYGPDEDGTQFPNTLASSHVNGGVGADYGAGGGGANDELADATDYDGGDGGQGVVRIIWGRGRIFPYDADEYGSRGNVTNYNKAG